MNVPVILRRRRLLSSTAFNPVSLFASGEEGALFLPGPTTSFLSTTDLTPAGAGDTVGFQLDTSQGAGYSGGAFTGLGPELVTNGTFDTDVSGWTANGVNTGDDVSFSWNASGYMEVTRGVDGTSGLPEQGFTTVSGNTYTISVDVVTAQRAFWRVGSTPGNNNLTGTVLHVGNTTVTLTFVATSTTSYVSFWTDNSTTTGIDNISVRELPGNHATQDTAAARPSYIVDDDGTFIQHDLVDDALTVTLPDMGTEATVAYVTRSEVRLLEDQTISGSYTLPTQEIAGFIAIDRALTFAEKVNVIRYLASKVEGVNYGAEIDRLTLIAINAVDVFVYDTSKDSDGGAWRTGALAQASSWYNETLNTATRGSRREFPAVAVIVAEADKVTIYDGDDPDLPMWSIWDLAPVGFNVVKTSVTTQNAKIVVGSRSGLFAIEFLLDRIRFLQSGDDSTSSITQHNKQTYISSASSYRIVNNTVNDVAMTVLPDAPIDPATGLPVPTIAVATDGGVSVIKDDGTVGSVADAKGPKHVVFDLETFNVLYTQSTFNILTNVVFHPAYTTAASIMSNLGSGAARMWANGSTGEHVVANDVLHVGGLNAVGGNYAGLQRTLFQGSTALANAYTTSTYNTGWMNGDIKGAFLSDTDDTDLVGSGELVTNGDFATDSDWTKGTGWTISGGVANLDTSVTGAGVFTSLAQNIATVAGKTYVLSVDISALTNVTTNEVFIRVDGATVGASITATGTEIRNFVASGASTAISIDAGAGQDGDETASIDNISVKLADEDRSVNQNGLVINGTITRTPVADGADLVAYSGFSASNYLEQPYNSDLDFGTGDFCVMGWVQLDSVGGGLQSMIFRRTSDNAAGYQVYFDVSGAPVMETRQSSSNSTSTGDALSTGAWNFICGLVKNSGTLLELYQNGGLRDSASITARNVGVDATLRIGNNSAGTQQLNGSLALLRISATVPTAEQIAKIYNDEKALFQENAQATLYGASDSVTALAHDPDTDLLHVGTSAGRSVFEGLRRVGNTTTSVSTSISASGGLIVEK